MTIETTACTCSRSEIASLTDEELIALCDLVGARLGEEIVKQSDREDAVANRLARQLTEQYTKDLDRAIESEFDRLDDDLFTPDEIPILVQGVGQRLDSRNYSEVMRSAVATLYLLGKRGGRSAARSAGRKPGGSVDIVESDQDLIDATSDIQLFWIGEYWSKHLSARIQATVTREALQGGLGRADVGRIMRGMVSGEFPGVRVPGTFQGNPEVYFRGLSGTVRTYGSTFGALTSIQEAEFERYTFEAVLDQRTSPICQFMHGRSFTVRSAVNLRARMLDRADPDQFKDVAGWKTVEQAQQIAGEGSTESQSTALSAAGLQMPPLHPHCRSLILPA